MTELLLLPPVRPTQRRMAQIVDAAAAVFAQKGYHGASTQDIADQLGMRQASLYYYFGSKEEALAAVCRIGVEGYVERARTVAASPISARQKVSALIRSHLSPIHDRADYVRVFLTQRQFLPTTARRRVRAAARAYEAIIASVIDAGVSLAADCIIGPHVYITGETTVGARNRFYAGAVIGEAPQDFKYKGEPTGLQIGELL